MQPDRLGVQGRTTAGDGHPRQGRHPPCPHRWAPGQAAAPWGPPTAHLLEHLQHVQVAIGIELQQGTGEGGGVRKIASQGCPAGQGGQGGNTSSACSQRGTAWHPRRPKRISGGPKRIPGGPKRISGGPKRTRGGDKSEGHRPCGTQQPKNPTAHIPTGRLLPPRQQTRCLPPRSQAAPRCCACLLALAPPSGTAAAATAPAAATPGPCAAAQAPAGTPHLVPRVVRGDGGGDARGAQLVQQGDAAPAGGAPGGVVPVLGPLVDQRQGHHGHPCAAHHVQGPGQLLGRLVGQRAAGRGGGGLRCGWAGWGWGGGGASGVLANSSGGW